LIAEVTHLEGPIEVPVSPAEHDLDYRTHFERRMRKAEMPVYRARFRKSL
jgi:tRNA (guanine-N7-)-methyltransferase